MLNVQQVEKQLEGIEEALSRIELERQALLGLKEAAESWISITKGTPPVKTHKPRGSGKKRDEGKEISLRSAVFQVLQEARGRSLHVTEIWDRAHRMGANTKADRPTAVIDSSLHAFHRKGGPVEKTGPATWKWNHTEQ
ncbi:MAG: hypothetical protein HYY09_03925 [Firmicutes bacterium]|nr:hypothetical protein [Bacillota bacterium]